ncbi:MAG: 16S rRNA (adenine(1518)-N(6)/adenine(1519)-N(6))-dimethyltransferase RsmA [Kiritimatiellaeota bacterium]|nr:16S rRNA (adenine(1518)-N(6)/adenine(1519)-N(6))-dimethyltransferase RsmA [Kiritimatiellota bacterium]
MNLSSPKNVLSLLESRGIKPNKTLGQNFLIDGNTLGLIADAAQLAPDSKVLEVGPGLGSLTERLLPRCARLTAIEKDPALAALLHERFAHEPKLTIIEGDALECDIPGIFASGTADTLVSNLPYSVGTRIVVEAALGGIPPYSMTVLLQKEVAERFVAAPRTPDYGALSVWLQTLYEIRIARKVPPSCFHPPPEVFSAVVTLRLRSEIPPHAAMLKLHALSKTAFLNRRKQLASSMRDEHHSADSIRDALVRINASPAARPEELNVAQWQQLATIW